MHDDKFFTGGQNLSCFSTDQLFNIEQFYQMAPFGLSIIDCNLKYLYINKWMAALNGKTVDEHIGRTIVDLVPNLPLNTLYEIKEAIRTGKSVTDLRVPSSEIGINEDKYFLVNRFLIKDRKGTKIGIVTIVQDITELKQSEMKTDKLLQFETLISNLSVDFVNLPTKDVDIKISHWLTVLAKHLDFDHICLSQISHKGAFFNVTHSSSGSRDKLVAIDALLKTPLYIEELLSAKVIVLNQIPNDLHFDITPHDKQQILLSNLKSCVVIPLTVKMSIKGLLFFANFENKGILSTEMINKFKLVGRVFSSALLRKQMEEKIANALSEIDQLKNRLQVENVYLRKEVEAKYHHDGIVGQSRAIRNVLALIEQVAKTDSTVLLMGETGTGKELLAISLHRLSKRSIRPMITVNCGGLPQTLIESELFGREKGAFTGAFSNQAGRFEVATESTIFLDEISELPLEVQPKLLRVLQEGQFERLGSPKTHFVDVRVIAATNINLDNAVLAGQFRKDLYYRLNVFPIHVPPLRDRPEDIPPLIWSFVREFEVVMRKNIEQVSKENMDFLQCYSWPGNVRELRNAVERAMILVQGRTLTIDVPNTTGRLTTQKLNLEEVERDHILRVLESSEWRVRGKNGAAEILGLKPTTLDSRLKKLKIKRKSPKYQTTSE